jgi:hypothetical protein
MAVRRSAQIQQSTDVIHSSAISALLLQTSTLPPAGSSVRAARPSSDALKKRRLITAQGSEYRVAYFFWLPMSFNFQEVEHVRKGPKATSGSKRGRGNVEVTAPSCWPTKTPSRRRAKASLALSSFLFRALTWELTAVWGQGRPSNSSPEIPKCPARLLAEDPKLHPWSETCSCMLTHGLTRDDHGFVGL